MARVFASAPGKLVILGEYAVLANAPALVMAVNRRCHAEIGPSDTGTCRVRSMADADRQVVFRRKAKSGLALVDHVVEAYPSSSTTAWRAVLDSSGLYREGRKLGLGSSAAALTAWSGAWIAWSGLEEAAESEAAARSRLIEAHTTFQGGTGSGLDVAASLHGGVIRFRIDPDSGPQVERARLPEGIGFVGVFARNSASTRTQLDRFRARSDESPASAAFWMDSLGRLSQSGIECAAAGDREGFLGATREYAGALQALGEWMGAEIFTPEHLRLLNLAERFDLVYKVSGAGGGDMGLAFGDDPQALARFRKAADERYDTIDLAIEPQGLEVRRADR